MDKSKTLKRKLEEEIERAREYLPVVLDEIAECEKQFEKRFSELMKIQAEVELKGKQLEQMDMDLERHRGEVNAEKEHLGRTEHSSRELEEEMERKKKDLSLVLAKTAECERQLETTSTELMKTQAEVDLKGKQLEQMNIDIEKRRGEVNAEMELLDKSKTRSRKQLESVEKQLDSQQKLLDEKAKKLESLEHKLAKCVEDYELKAKKLQSLDEQQLVEAPISHSTDSPCCMDDLEGSSAFAPNEVFIGLQGMTDPAAYVLSVFEDEIMGAQRRGDQLGLSEPLVKNLVLLLEELQRVVKPSDHLLANASQVANRWSSTMRTTSQVSPLESWGFLQFILAYGLVLRTDPDKTSIVLQVESSHQAGRKRQRQIVNHQLGDKYVPSQEQTEEPGAKPQPDAIATHPSSTQTKPNIFSGSITADMLRDVVKKKPIGESEDLFNALKCTQDPAKLVLDTSMALCPSNPEGSYEFKLLITSANCFLLLNQLKKLMPQIGNSVKDDAKKIAVYWKDKFSESKQCNLEVICFLEFLGIFGIVSEFKADEILGLLNNSYWRTVSPNLCQFLGLEKSMRGFILNLKRTGDHLKAVDYIYSLDMVHKFEPVSSIIKYSLKITKEFAEKSFREAKNDYAAQVAAIDREIKTLRNAIKYIKSHKLESEFESENLEERLKSLLKIRGNGSASGSGSKPGLTIQQSKTAKPPNVAEVGSVTSKTPLEPSMAAASSSANNLSRNTSGRKRSLSGSIQSSGQVASLTSNYIRVPSLTSNPFPVASPTPTPTPTRPRPQPQPQLPPFYQHLNPFFKNH